MATSLFCERALTRRCQMESPFRSKRVTIRRKPSVHSLMATISIYGFRAGSKALPMPPARLCAIPNPLTTHPAWLAFTLTVPGSIALVLALFGGDRLAQALVGHLSTRVSGITILRMDGPGSVLIRGAGCLLTLGDGAFLRDVVAGITSHP